MNWGIRIVLLYLGFVALILTLVFTSVNNPSELEYKDYYARELKFQDLIDATNNANQLSAPISYTVNGKSISISIPEELRSEQTTGLITMLRPSDTKLDKEFKLQASAEGLQTISDPQFAKGVYRLGISIEKNKRRYYKEAVVNLNE